MPLYQLSESLQAIVFLGEKPKSQMDSEHYRRLQSDEINKLNFKYLIIAFKYLLNSDKNQLMQTLSHHCEFLVSKIHNELDLVSSIYLCQVLSKMGHKSRTDTNSHIESILQAINKKTAKDIKEVSSNSYHRQNLTIE